MILPEPVSLDSRNVIR